MYRKFSAFVAASVALHAALLLVSPTVPQRAASVEVLEVTLMRDAPPRVAVPAQPAPQPRTERAEARKVEKLAPRAATSDVVPRPASEAPRESRVLALPQTAPEPAFTMPQAASSEAASDPGPRQETAKAAPAGPTASTQAAASGAGSGPITPPDANAAYLRNPRPPYPPTAQRRGEQGTVTLRVLVTREGAAAKVNVEKSSGHSSLDAAAVDAVRGWRFAPARQAGQPVEAWVLVPVVFKLEG